MFEIKGCAQRIALMNSMKSMKSKPPSNMFPALTHRPKVKIEPDETRDTLADYEMSRSTQDAEAFLDAMAAERDAEEAAKEREQARAANPDNRRRSDQRPKKIKTEADDDVRVKDEDGDTEMPELHIKGLSKAQNGSKSSRRSSPDRRGNREPNYEPYRGLRGSGQNGRRGSEENGRHGSGENGRRGSGDHYRGGGHPRTPRGRSRSPERDRGDRYYRPVGRDDRRRDRDDDDPEQRRYRPNNGPNSRAAGLEPHEVGSNARQNDGNQDQRRGPPTPRRGNRSASPRKRKPAEPQLTEDERDRRTVFVQQLAARLRTKELVEFFTKAGPVKEAQIVKDRVSQRSKGVGYVEFKNEESVEEAIKLTGQKLLGLPIIAQLTEAEKNRQARTTEKGDGNKNSIPFHRLYVGNIHFSVTEDDLNSVFSPFGELEFTQLQKDDQERSRGYGFVQFLDPASAKDALEKMNGFQLAGRPIRVGLGNDKFTPETTANLLQRFNGREQAYQGSAFSGQGGRGSHAGGGGGNFDRAGGRDNDKGAGGASALDDADVSGVNFSNYSRDSLMRKLARTDDGDKEGDTKATVKKEKKEEAPVASRCVVLKNMFDPVAELKNGGEGWVKELEEEVKTECIDKYGAVVHISVDPNSQGDVYLKFDRVLGGENAIKGLNGRFFGGQMVSASFMVSAVYDSLFPKAKAV